MHAHLNKPIAKEVRSTGFMPTPSENSRYGNNVLREREAFQRSSPYGGGITNLSSVLDRAKFSKVRVCDKQIGTCRIALSNLFRFSRSLPLPIKHELPTSS